MKALIANNNDFAIGAEGTYFPKQEKKEIEVDIELLRTLNKHTQIEVEDVYDFNPNKLSHDKLQTIGVAKGLSNIASYTKDEFILEFGGDLGDEEGDS